MWESEIRHEVCGYVHQRTHYLSDCVIHFWRNTGLPAMVSQRCDTIAGNPVFLHPIRFQPTKYLSLWYAVSRAYGFTLIPLHRSIWPRIWGFRNSGSLVKWRCHHVMVKADTHLRPLHTSILDIYKVLEPLTLVSCHKGIWVHPYTVTPAKFAPNLGESGSFEEWHWCHRVMIEADIHLLSQGHIMGAPLYHYTGQVTPRFGGVRIAWGGEMML